MARSSIDPSEVLIAAGLQPDEVQVMDGLSLDDIATEGHTSFAGGLSGEDTVGIPVAVKTADEQAEVIPTIGPGVGRVRVGDTSMESTSSYEHSDVVIAKKIQDAVENGELEEAIDLFYQIHSDEASSVMISTLNAGVENFTNNILKIEEKDDIVGTEKFESARIRINKIKIESLKSAMIDLVDNVESAAILKSSESTQIKVLMTLRLGKSEKIKQTLIEIGESIADLNQSSHFYSVSIRKISLILGPFGITEEACEQLIKDTENRGPGERKVKINEFLRTNLVNRYGNKP